EGALRHAQEAVAPGGVVVGIGADVEPDAAGHLDALDAARAGGGSRAADHAARDHVDLDRLVGDPARLERAEELDVALDGAVLALIAIPVGVGVGLVGHADDGERRVAPEEALVATLLQRGVDPGLGEGAAGGLVHGLPTVAGADHDVFGADLRQLLARHLRG